MRSGLAAAEAVSASASDFAVARLDGDLGFITDLALGNAEYPDQSATLILMVEDISDKADMILRGPGIKESQNLSVPGLPAALTLAIY